MTEERNIIPIKNKRLFKTKVVEIYDPIHLQKYWYVKVLNSKDFNDVLSKLIDNYTEIVDIADEDDSSDGECLDLTINGHLVIMFWCNTTSISSIVHECLHAVMFCAKSRGIKYEESDETLCYMLGFLVNEVFNKISLTLKNKS